MLLPTISHPSALEHILAGIPQDVWHSVWHPSSTNILSRVSKSMHATVRALRLPDAARMSRDWWLRYTGLPSLKKWAFALEALHRRAASATLTSIALHCNSQCSALVPFFEAHAHLHPTLQTFSIASNGNLGPLGAAVVARALLPCTAITDLDLTRNDVGVEGVRSLAPVLTTFRNLTRLALARNALGDSGVEAVAKGLHLCAALDTLDLSGNAMQAGGAIELANHIAGFSQLTHLNVGHNNMQNLGAEILSHALSHLSIRHLDFCDNR
jgi:Leucine-rich repeat (LRR) protein